MELIIDISDKVYNDIQSRDWKNGELVFSEEWKAIRNGIPLEQIRPEIDEEQEQEEDDYVGWVTYHNKAVNDALLAIDNLCYAKKMIDIYR